MDGVFLQDSAEHQMLSGKIARIPVVNGARLMLDRSMPLGLTACAGNDGDEGTAFAFPTLNLT